MTRPRREGEEDVKDIQVLLRDESNAVGIRDVQAANMSQLCKISGIVIAASSIRVKATHLTLQCRGCKSFLNNVPIKRGLEGFALPRKCAALVLLLFFSFFLSLFFFCFTFYLHTSPTILI